MATASHDVPGGGPGGVGRRSLLAAAAAGLGLVACASPDEEETAVAPERSAYGEDAAQWGELTRPAGASRGVVAVIHGGFWRQQYVASLGAPLAADLAARGWTAWNVEYRRVGGGGGVPETLDDVAAALDHLATLDVDTSTLVTLGHSAGGHLAIWAASRTRFDRWAGGVEVTHVVSQAGVVDLAQGAADRLGNGAVQAFVGGEPSDVPRAYELADPTPQLPLTQPVWCVHARDDDTVPFSQSEDYVARATGATLVEVDGGHFGVIDPTSSAWAAQVAVLDEIRPRA